MNKSQNETMINFGFLSIDSLRELPTPRLLAYFKKYKSRLLHHTAADDEWGYDKNYEDAKPAYIEAIKSILSKREHVE